MTKKLTSLIGAILTVALLNACNSGSTSSSVTPQTQYYFTAMAINTSGLSGCTSINLFNYSCNASSSSLPLNISYTSQPASYLVSPTTIPTGVSFSTSGSCSTSPVSSYSCSFNISSSGVASGTVLSIPITGSLGQQNFITVIFN